MESSLRTDSQFDFYTAIGIARSFKDTGRRKYENVLEDLVNQNPAGGARSEMRTYGPENFMGEGITMRPAITPESTALIFVHIADEWRYAPYDVDKVTVPARFQLLEQKSRGRFMSTRRRTILPTFRLCIREP